MVIQFWTYSSDDFHRCSIHLFERHPVSLDLGDSTQRETAHLKGAGSESIQPSLPLRLVDHAKFENYQSHENRRAVHLLQQLLSHNLDQTSGYLWGAAGSGKTHLLFAACKQTSNSIYFPLLDLRLAPNYLEGAERYDLVCIDDVQSIARQLDWERKLFSLFEKIETQKSILLIAANVPPAQLRFELKDLVSRFLGRQIFKVVPASEQDKLKILVDWTARRGMKIDPAVARFILTRHSRDMHSIMRLCERLDQISFDRQRRITIQFLKQLEEFQDSSEITA